MALDAVSSRKYLLRGGYVYFPAEKAVYTFVRQFKLQLEKELEVYSKYLQDILNKYENIRPILLNLHTLQTKTEFSMSNKTTKGRINLADIDALSERLLLSPSPTLSLQ